MDYGNWQGMTLAEVERLDPDGFAAYRSDPLRAAVPGGESQRLLGERVTAALHDALAALPPDGHLVLVAHGGPLREVLRHYGLWRGGAPPGNASRTVLDLDAAGQATAERIGDVTHLPPELRPDASGTTFLAEQ